MIDSHCHFDFDEFDWDREQEWQAALSLGLKGLLIPATEPSRFNKVQQLCHRYPNWYYALGLHPWFLSDSSAAVILPLENAIAAAAEDSRFVALGETGLDFTIALEQQVQIRYFEAHLHLAQALSLPVIVHHHKSHNKIIQLLRRTPNVSGVIHAFSGSEQEAHTYVDMGFKLGVGGTITYPRSLKTQRAIRSVGLEHLLLETDAPAMPIFGKQGKRNSPTNLPVIVEALSHLLQVTVEEVSEVTTRTFHNLFLSPPSQ